MDSAQFETWLAQAISARFALLDPQHQTPCRLFNGFLEGEPRPSFFEAVLYFRESRKYRLGGRFHAVETTRG